MPKAEKSHHAHSQSSRGRGKRHRHGAPGRSAQKAQQRLSKTADHLKREGSAHLEVEDKPHERIPDGTHEEDYIFFWKPDQEYGWASQWHFEPFEGAAQLEMEGEPEPDEPATRTFYTAENWMMYHKAMLFGDKETAEEILDATDPKEVKALGRKAANFDEEVWQQQRYDIVLEGNKTRFQASEELRKNLLATGDKLLVEASKFDKIWGVGFSQKDAFWNREKWGLNLLGKVLMDVRKFLREQEAESNQD